MKALTSRHVKIYLPENDAIEMVDSLVSKFPALALQSTDPLDQYLETYRLAAETIKEKTGKGGEAFFQSAQRRVRLWGRGLLLEGEACGFQVKVMLSHNWISLVFANAVTEANAEFVASGVCSITGGEFCLQKFPYPHPDHVVEK